MFSFWFLLINFSWNCLSILQSSFCYIPKQCNILAEDSLSNHEIAVSDSVKPRQLSLVCRSFPLVDVRDSVCLEGEAYSNLLEKQKVYYNEIKPGSYYVYHYNYEMRILYWARRPVGIAVICAIISLMFYLKYILSEADRKYEEIINKYIKVVEELKNHKEKQNNINFIRQKIEKKKLEINLADENEQKLI